MSTATTVLPETKRKELLNLIAKGDRLQDVFIKLKSVAEKLPPGDRNDLILLESQYNEFRRVRMRATEDTAELTREFNRINYRVTEFIDLLATANVSGLETATPSQNLLNNYPRPRPIFGYAEETMKLQGLLASENIVGIYGIGGVGKTAFVTNFIEKHIDDKSRVIWQENCSEFQFDTFVSNIGYGEILKKTKGEDKYYHLLKQLECDGRIVFLDNFDPELPQENEFVEFLKTIGKYLKNAQFVLIGGLRFNLPPLSIYNIELKGLNPSEAVSFAKSLEAFSQLNLPDEKLLEIAEKVRGNPQLVKSALDSLRYGVPWDDLFSSLSKDDPYEKLLQSVFRHPEEKAFLLRFSVFKNQVSRSAVKYVVGTDGQVFNDTLKSLIDKSVLSVIPSFDSDSEPSFTTSNLIRERSYAQLEDPKPLHRKAADYFLQQRKETLDIDLENRIFYQARQADWYEKVHETMKNYGRQFILLGHFSLVNDMLQYLKERNAISPICYILLGKMHYIKGDFDKALQYYQEAGQLAGDEKEESYVQIEGQLRTGWIYYRQGKLSKALQQIHSGFIASREARNEPLEVEALNKLGWIYNIYDKPEVTKGFYREAERIATKLELPSMLGHVYESLGSLYIDLEEYDDALSILNKGLEYFTQVDHREGMAFIHRNLGHYYLKTGNFLKAREYYDSSLKYYLQIQYKLGIARVRMDLGWLEVLREDGDRDCGINQIKNAIGLSRSIDDWSGAVFGYYSIGKIGFDAGEKPFSPALSSLFHAKALQLKSGQRTHRMLPRIQAIIDQITAGKPFTENLGLAREAYQMLPDEVKSSISLERLLE
ncbi:MAG: tetratricopeptide repeat protein [Lewinellaceae bacterium]|nr:tetratricopeptide repeat protein [Phaeodactylibacter sp.]MCB9039476.1 tetratricopeptide repeat protein [Lewinellaceae bacterium]